MIVLAMVCCLLWGSAFPCIKLGYSLCEVPDEAASQILFAGCRFLLAGIMAVIICSFIRKRPLFPKNTKSVSHVAILSVFQTILQYVFFYIGLSHTSGVKASVIEGANVFVVLFVTVLIFKMERPELQKLIGAIIGFGGVMLINMGSGFDFSFRADGEGFILISTVAYALSSVFLKRFGKDDDPLMLSGWQFIVGGIFMIAVGAVFGGHFTVNTAGAFLMLVYLAFVSAAAYSLWSVLLNHNPVSQVAVYGFMNPVFGVILSALLLGEAKDAFNIRSLVSLVLVCGGIYIVNRQSANERSEARQ